jgi:hypothetical protein
VRTGLSSPKLRWTPEERRLQTRSGGWVQSLGSPSREEKDKILWKNLESLLKF